MQTDATKELFRPADAAAYLGCSRSKLQHIAETDPTFPRKVRISSRHVGFLKSSIDRWLASKEQGRAA